MRADEEEQGYDDVFPEQSWKREAEFYTVQPREFCEDVYNFTTEYVENQLDALEENVRLEFPEKTAEVSQGANDIYELLLSAMDEKLKVFSERAAERVFRIPPGLEIEGGTEEEKEEGERLESERREATELDDEIRELRAQLEKELAARQALRAESHALNAKQSALEEIERRLDLVTTKTEECGVNPITPVLSTIEAAGSQLREVLDDNLDLLRKLKVASGTESEDGAGQLSVPMPDLESLKGVAGALKGQSKS